MNKKMFALFIVVLMVINLTASCTINPDKTDSSAAQTTATQTPPASQPDAATAAPTEAANVISELNAKYPLITDPNVNEPGTLPIVKEMVTLSIGVVQDPNVISYAYEDNYLTKYLQDRTNVALEIELFPDIDVDQKIEIMVSSGAKLPDILFGLGMTDDRVRFRNGQAGALIPLNDYYEQLAVEIKRSSIIADFEYEDLLKYIVSPDGNIYGLAEISNCIPDLTTHRAWFNMNFLDAVGLEIPQTQDEFVTVLRAFKELDPNGNGRSDEIPMLGSTNGWNADPITWLMQQYIYVNNKSDRYMLIENGALDVAYDKPEWRDGLRFTKSLIDEGLLSTLSFTQDYTAYRGMVAADEQIVGLGVSGSISGFGQNIQYHEGADAILGPNGSRYTVYTPGLPWTYLAITKYCEDPVVAFLWCCSHYSDELYQIIYQYGEPDVNWEYSKPGTIGMYEGLGIPALFRVTKICYGEPSSSHWQHGPLPFVAQKRIINGMESDGNENNNELKNAKAVTRLAQYVPDLSKIFVKNIYTPDEIDQTSEIRTNLRLYIDEASVLFVTGALDIEKDWDAYLQELNNLKYKEILAVDQEAYTRTQQGVN